jgi:hypothetical protein
MKGRYYTQRDGFAICRRVFIDYLPFCYEAGLKGMTVLVTDCASAKLAFRGIASRVPAKAASTGAGGTGIGESHPSDFAGSNPGPATTEIDSSAGTRPRRKPRGSADHHPPSSNEQSLITPRLSSEVLFFS